MDGWMNETVIEHSKQKKNAMSIVASVKNSRQTEQGSIQLNCIWKTST